MAAPAEGATSSGESIEATLARLRADASVESAEVDQRRFPHAVPTTLCSPAMV